MTVSLLALTRFAIWASVFVAWLAFMMADYEGMALAIIVTLISIATHIYAKKE